MGGNSTPPAFYSGVEPALFSQAGVGVRGSLRLDTCVPDEWISPGGGMCMLKLRLLDISLSLIQVYRPNSSALYIEFVEERKDASAMCPINARHIRLDGQMQRCLVSGVVLLAMLITFASHDTDEPLTVFTTR